MKKRTIKAGDKVKFLNDVGGGTVTKLIDNETALVLNDTGFEIPVLINELLPEILERTYESVSNDIAPKSQESVFEKDPIITDSIDVNSYLAFVPQNPKLAGDSDCDVFLINDSNYFVYYNYALKKGEKYESITGKLEPNVKEKISVYDINYSNDSLDIVVQIIYYGMGKYVLKEPVSTFLKIKTGRFFKQGSYKANDFFDENALVLTVSESHSRTSENYLLDNDTINKAVKEKHKNEQINKAKTFKKKEEKYIKEIDLHIHELIDDESGMSDHDKLQYQLDVFHRELKSAIKENYKRIVFIHGVGSGSLKLKIRSELQHTYKHLQFQDASFKEYGYGATMVLLRK
jgi:hypothetical protein